ncbi:MAG: chemotaxis protein CheW [Magnetospirillum sp.]|nr:chemotaxis protein CheW [Magnetospirillum sp.]
MTAGEDDVRRALRGEGPIFLAMLEERARELAVPPEPEAPEGAFIHVLRLVGAGGRWALPVRAVRRVEPLGRCLTLPDEPASVLGMALLAGRCCLVTDLDALLTGAAMRPPQRPGHAVLLREHDVALVVDWADAVLPLPHPGEGRQRLADGSRLLDVARLVAALTRGGDA